MTINTARRGSPPGNRPPLWERERALWLRDVRRRFGAARVGRFTREPRGWDFASWKRRRAQERAREVASA